MNIAFDDDRQIRGLIAAARHAASQGNAADADRFIAQAEKTAPRHPLVMNETALRSLHAGDVASAVGVLQDLVRSYPSYAEVWFNLAIALAAAGRLQEAIGALDRSLALNPRNAAALLEKGALQERLDDARGAAVTYHAALQTIPPGVEPPAGLRDALRHAKDAVDANHHHLEHFIEDELAPLRARYADESLKRFDRCVDLLLRKRRIYHQQPTFMYFPELPAIEFYDRELFPWLEELEAAAPGIRDELTAILAERGTQALDPYVSGPAGTAAREGLGRWRSYPFWREGRPYPERMARCPRTMKALESCPQWDAPGIGPNTMFSVLEPKTRIAPHTGTANTRLVTHLALIVPPACGFRVGGEQREWHEGQAFVFDDTIEHEAGNDSDETRAILIVDVWSPFLSTPERELVRALSAKVGKYYGKLPDEPEPVGTAA